MKANEKDTFSPGTTDITLSRMGLGTWAIGGGPAWNGDLDRQICTDTILEAHRCGINLIDTAPGYNFGNSEAIVGQALKKLPREQVVVETKCGGTGNEKEVYSTKLAIGSCIKTFPGIYPRRGKSGCQRLGIDYIDIYMTHWQSVPPFFTPIAETVAVLNELKAEGKIRAIGAANVDADHIREYLQYGELDIIRRNTVSSTGQWKTNCCRYVVIMALWFRLFPR
ncbi:aldo/keto reductase [Escherichia coli]